MTFVIVPNDLRDHIYKVVDEQLELVPDLKHERENIYNDLLSYYNDNGVVPDFKLEKK